MGRPRIVKVVCASALRAGTYRKVNPKFHDHDAHYYATTKSVTKYYASMQYERRHCGGSKSRGMEEKN